jgi:hypothetical protein
MAIMEVRLGSVEIQDPLRAQVYFISLSFFLAFYSSNRYFLKNEFTLFYHILHQKKAANIVAFDER